MNRQRRNADALLRRNLLIWGLGGVIVPFVGIKVIDVVLTKPGDEVVLSTRRGMAIRFDEQNARAMGRNTRGVKGISLVGDDEVVGMVVADPEGYLLTVCENGYGKRTPFGANQPLDAADVAAVEAAVRGEEKLVAVFTQRNSGVDDPQLNDLYPVGTKAVIRRMGRAEDTIQALVQGTEPVEQLLREGGRVTFIPPA